MPGPDTIRMIVFDWCLTFSVFCASGEVCYHRLIAMNAHLLCRLSGWLERRISLRREMGL